MSFKTLFAAIAGIAAAVALTVLYRGLGREVGSAPDDAHATHEAELAARSVTDTTESTRSTPGTPAAVPANPSRSERDLAWQTELRGASESFRNSTLLIAIRENGFPCADVTSAAQGGDPLGGWHVTCRGVLMYLVAAGASGQLVVEPVPVGDTLGLGRPPESLPDGPLPQFPPNR
jgi:hypothetical protein